MSRIIPIPTTRVGSLFVSQRLVDQVQHDQLSLFEIQNQISTGYRLQVPSDDAPAALRAINLQRLLDRKGQIRTNLQASNSFLGTAWDRLGSVSTMLSELRGTIVSVTGTTANDASRQAAIQEVDIALRELVNAGNARYQGRYLFAGSRSQIQPYGINGEYVEYFGNEGTLRSYVDLEQLFETNLAGTDVFGGISASVKGSADLNPQLTSTTLVSTLNGGNGIGKNPAVSVSVTDGTTVTSIVDLSSAVTIGDVARLIEAGAPAGTTVEVTGSGLVVRTDSGAIRVGEVAQGHTARQLGILSDLNAPPSATLVGDELNPVLLKTTRLDDLLGTKALGVIESAGANNDIALRASANGAHFNGLTVAFVDDVALGNEAAIYDQGTNTLTIRKSATSTANHVAAAISAEGTFTATIDYHDTTSTAQAGTGVINFVSATIDGGSGDTLDTASGLILTNGGQSKAVDIGAAKTVEDLLNSISGAGLGLLAEINAAGTGINVRSRLSGADFTIGENGGTTATQLGIRTYTESTGLAALNRGLGVPTNITPANDDFVITTRDGTQLSVNLHGAGKIEDVIDRVNSHVDNSPPKVLARLAATGNGIELIDLTVGIDDLTVSRVEGSQAAEFLGFVPAGEAEVSSATGVLQSQDRHTLEVDSVFNTLARLKTALENNDTVEIGRALERLDADMDRVNYARAEMGSRLQNLEVIDLRLQDEDVQLRAALSQDIDVDLVKAISDLTARQYAFQASLQTAGSLMQLSLLDFL